MRWLLVMFFALTPSLAWADAAAAASVAATDKVLVSGTVADNATKADILNRLRSVYGSDAVVDQLEVGDVVEPAKWGEMVAAMITPDLKKVSQGSVSVHGNAVNIEGKVASDEDSKALLAQLTQTFNSHYSISPDLSVGLSGQALLDKTLAGRTVEFKSGSTILTRAGENVLVQMAAAIKTLKQPFIQVIGNTDSVGNREANIQLSLNRARAVKEYLVKQGVSPASLSVSGMGPDSPVASNDTEEGRSRNRRIDFKLYKQ